MREKYPKQFVEGKDLEDKLEVLLKKNNIKYERNVRIDVFRVDFFIDDFYVVELSLTTHAEKIESLCFRGTILTDNEFRQTIVIVPFKKLTPRGAYLLLRFFNIVLDVEDMEKIVDIVNSKFGYKEYLLKKLEEYPKLRTQIKRALKEWFGWL